MGDQHPLDPFVQFEGIVDALRDAAIRLPGVGSAELADASRIAREEIEALRTALESSFVTISGWRKLLAVEREALVTFAMANGLCE